MNVINLPYGTPGILSYPGININYKISKPSGIPIPMSIPTDIPPFATLGFPQLGIAQMIQPGYNFKLNDLMYLGSTLLHKINFDQQRLQQVMKEKMGNLKSEELKKPEKSKKPEIPEESINISDLIDTELVKDAQTDVKIDKLVEELAKKGNLEDTTGTKIKSKDLLKRFVRTVKFITATQKLLEKAPEILKKRYEELGIDTSDPKVVEYLVNIEKGTQNTITLQKLLKDSGIILNDEQNLIVLDFLKKVLEGFTLGSEKE